MENKLPKVGTKFKLKNAEVEIINVSDEGFDYRQQDGTENWDCFEDFSDFYEEIEPHKEEEKPKLTVTDGKIIMNKPDYEFNLEDGEKQVEEEKPTPYVHSAKDKALEELKEFLDYLGDGSLSGTEDKQKTLGKSLFIKSQNLVNALEETELGFYLKSNGWDKIKPSGLVDDPTIPQAPVSGISEPTAECNQCGNLVSQGIWLERQGYCGTSCQYDAKHKKTQDKPKSIWKDVSELPRVAACETLIALSKADKVPNFATYNLDKGVWCYIDDAAEISPRTSEFCTLTDFLTDYESEKKARIDLEGRVEKLEKTIFEIRINNNGQ